jgi:hypothetical protein
MNPLLSICIPTRNRAETLRLTLENVLSEARPLGGQVEVLVSDNASTDHTAEVLQAFAPWIRYRIRETNVGYFGNLVGLATDLARGRMVWALGDDDLVLRGGLGRALQAVAANPEPEVFYLNYGWIPVPDRNRLIASGDSRFTPATADLHFPVAGSRTLPRLEDLALLPSRNAAGIFCAMFSYLLPRSFFESFGRSVSSRLWDCFSTDVDDIYPHAKILMRAFHGRPVHLVAEPCLMQGQGLWEYNRWAVTYKIVPLLRLLDYFESLGVGGAPMARMREDFAATAGRNFARMVLDPEANQGMAPVMAEAFPRLAGSSIFWDRFFRLYRETPRPEAAVRLLELLSEAHRNQLAQGVLDEIMGLQEG